jgi:prophage regulatory protein
MNPGTKLPLGSESLVRLLRLPTVLACSGRSRSGLYELIAKGLWPKPVSLGARAVAWPAHEVTALVQATIAGASEAQVRALVGKLHAARQHSSLDVGAAA